MNAKKKRYKVVTLLSILIALLAIVVVWKRRGICCSLPRCDELKCMRKKKHDTKRNKSTHIQLTNDLSLKAAECAQSGIDGLTAFSTPLNERRRRVRKLGMRLYELQRPQSALNWALRALDFASALAYRGGSD